MTETDRTVTGYGLIITMLAIVALFVANWHGDVSDANAIGLLFIIVFAMFPLISFACAIAARVKG